MITKEHMEEMVGDVMPSVVARVKEELQERVTQQTMQEVQEVVRAEVKKYAQDVIAPEVRRILMETDHGLAGICETFGKTVGEKLTVALSANLDETLKNSWSRAEVFKALFKG